MAFTGKRLEVNGLHFNVVHDGSGPPVLLLHGFPDSHRLWRNQIPALVRAGFAVVAPDLRGFGDSDRPDEVDAYAMPSILGDVTGMLDQLGIARAHVVGHDWGAAVAWFLASFHPDRVDRLGALSVGHPASFAAAGIEQREKSWYMLLFQFEGIAETALRHDDWRLFREWTREHSELGKWTADLSRPGALRAALNWYRANVNPQALLMEQPQLPPVQAPSLGVWSTGDAYLTEAQMTGSSAHVASSWQYERIEDASHWIPLDQPDRLNELLVRFLRLTA